MPFWTLRRKVVATVTLMIALTFGWAAVVVAVALTGAHDEARSADAIAVLGAAQYNGRPSRVPSAARPRGGPVSARPRARGPGDRWGGIGRHPERVGRWTAVSPESGAPRRRGRRAAGGREHVGLPGRRCPLVLREREPPRPARVRWLSHATPPDHRHPTRPPAVHLPCPQFPHPVESASQRGLLPRRGVQGPCHLALQPLRVPMQLESRRAYTGRVVRLDVDTVRFPDGS